LSFIQLSALVGQ